MHVCEKPDLAAGEMRVRTEDAHYGVPVVAAGVAGEEGVVQGGVVEGIFAVAEVGEERGVGSESGDGGEGVEAEGGEGMVAGEEEGGEEGGEECEL
jgi:hypothetical protein